LPDHPVIQLDIQPTALAAAGGSVKKQWGFDGVNLLPDLEDKATGRPREKLFCRLGPHWAIRQGDWKRMKAPEEKMLPTTALPKMPVGPVHL
jgi:arylsulfatase A-like enzyme